MEPKHSCEHLYKPLGFNIIKQTEDFTEAVACVFCEKCSLFRTKILVFRREFINKTGE